MGDELASRAPAWRLRRFATVDSTNRWLLDEARGGAAAGLVAVADYQTSGRGRRGRTWSAEPGSSLLVSVLVRPSLDAEHVQLVTMAAALAMCEAVQRIAGFPAALKWPNDLVVGDRKLAGVLAEADVSASGEVRAVVVGVGCNVASNAVPPELEATATSCEGEAGHPIGRDQLLDAYLDALSPRLDDVADQADGGPDAVTDGYRARLSTIGRRVRVDLGDRVLEGTATGVDAVGRLLVDTGAPPPIALAAGDVEHLRPA